MLSAFPIHCKLRVTRNPGTLTPCDGPRQRMFETARCCVRVSHVIMCVLAEF
jgi:hypothetical protein